ncbi:MAG: hypothetical protein ACRDP6_20950 [Actinoallomurus sp.]
MSARSQTEQNLDQPQTRTAFRGAKLLVGTYFALSVATFAAIVVLRGHSSVVNDAVWIRGSIVVASAALMTSFVARAARGSDRAYLRLRLVSAIMVVAIAVIISLPGTFPVWMKIEQGVCGLLLIGVVVLVNRKHVRSSFAAG